MEKATEIFEKHWTKATGNPLDETTKHHMKYAIEAINEALLLGAVSEQLPNFLYEDDGQIKIGYHGDTVVTDEWNKWKEGNLR